MPENFIVKTQLVPPKLRKDAVRRDRLLRILHKSLDKRLVLVTGGAGYGKTTLLSQFVNELDISSVFYTASETDGNLNTFLAYVVEGIRQTHKRFGTRTQSVLDTPKKHDLQILMGTFVNELVDIVHKDLFIILDDFHLVDRQSSISNAKDSAQSSDAATIDKAFNYLFDHLPSNIHFMISSRTLPSFSTARLRAKGNLAELTTDDLRFTRKEIHELFRRNRETDISDASLRDIESYSEGWITELQAISHMMERDQGKALPSFKHKKQSYDYFIEEVFLQQPEEVRSFLTESCVLSQMTTDSCDAVLRRNDSDKMLTLLTSRNLFVSCTDEESRVFQYHQLFRDFLINRLAGNPALRHSLYSRAAAYYEANRDYASSIRHNLAASNTDEAVRIIEEQGDALMAIKRQDMLGQWLEWLGPDLIGSRPALLVFQGQVLWWEGKLDQALLAYEEANMLARTQGEGNIQARAMRGIANTLCARGLYKKATAAGEEALQLAGKGELQLRVQIMNTLGACHYYSQRYVKATSVVSEALKLCEKTKCPSEEQKLRQNLLACHVRFGNHEEVIEVGERMIAQEKPTCSSSYLYHTIARVHALRGEFARSRELLRKALELSRSFNDSRGVTSAFMDLGFLYLTQGDYNQARSYYRKTLKLNAERAEKAITEEVFHEISRSYLLQGDLIRAEEYINRVSIEKEHLVENSFLVTKGEIALESGDAAEGKKILELILDPTAQPRAEFTKMFAHAALARFYHKNDERDLLVEHLAKALEISKKGGHHFALLNMARMDSFLLQFAVTNNVAPRYARFLLDRFGPEYDLVVSFFGGLHIKRGGGKVAQEKWVRQKSRSLFCYLLANKSKRFTKDWLVELFWPGRVFSRTKSNLSTSLANIRQVISAITKKETSFVDYRDNTYGVSSDYRIWLDLEQFTQLMSEARKSDRTGNERIAMNKYEEAIGLYHGDLLPEVYDDWSEEMRIYCKEQYLRALDRVSAFCLKQEKYDRAIDCSKRIIACDEFREPAYLICMRSYIAQGKRKAATGLYKKLEKILKDELDATPSEETKRLFRELTEGKDS
jgi:ATP/maltotriose-dependent transcriptional regulator MalT/two-component SAPR family response regulator